MTGSVGARTPGADRTDDPAGDGRAARDAVPVDRPRETERNGFDLADRAAVGWRVGLLAIALVALALRVWNLPARGTWDADQGHDMLVLRDLVTHGVVPLLGPTTSIGTFHHGAFYYYLLAPAAAIGADPAIVVTEIALVGVLAVVLTALAARELAGPLAGLVAGLLLAVSASAIDESTFIWNPNLVAATAALAVLGVLRAHRTMRVRWWLAAFVGAALTMQCHVLGALLLPPVVLALLAAIIRAPSRDRGPLVRALVAGIAIVVATYLPLLAYELGHDFAESRAIAAFALGGGGSTSAGPLIRALVVALRVLSWPLVGLVTDAPVLALVATAGVVVAAVAAWRSRAPGGRWLVLTLAWGIVGLTIAAPSLATVVPGLPVDHYHAFLDPVVVVLVGAAVARLAIGADAVARGRAPSTLAARGGSRPDGPAVAGPAVAGPAVAGPAVAVLLLVATIAWNVYDAPPARAADGGWPAADAAAGRIAQVVAPDLRPAAGADIVLAAVTSDQSDAVVGWVTIPAFKSADAYRFPLERRGIATSAATSPSADLGTSAFRFVVVVCDDLFRDVTGSACGGPAEGRRIVTGPGRLVDRFEAAPGRWISVYATGRRG